MSADQAIPGCLTGLPRRKTRPQSGLDCRHCRSCRGEREHAAADITSDVRRDRGTQAGDQVAAPCRRQEASDFFRAPSRPAPARAAAAAGRADAVGDRGGAGPRQSVVDSAVLAAFIALGLNPIVAGLARVHVPRMLGSVLLLLVLGVGIGAAVNALSAPAADWIR